MIRSNTYEKVCHQIAVDISNKVKENHLVLGLATGSTPIGIYKELVKIKPDFSKTITFNLDEYVGLKETHDQSYRYFMNEHLFQYLDFEKNYFPNEQNYNQYDIMIKNCGGIENRELIKSKSYKSDQPLLQVYDKNKLWIQILNIKIL